MEIAWLYIRKFGTLAIIQIMASIMDEINLGFSPATCIERLMKSKVWCWDGWDRDICVYRRIVVLHRLKRGLL